MPLKSNPKYKIQNRNNGQPKTRIMVFGTFDALHPGHLNFFRQARALASRPFLIVSVARDKNVKRIKGQKPLRGERLRLKSVRQYHIVDKAVLGEPNGYLSHIVKEKPDIIALGHDQKEYTRNLRIRLKERGLDVKIRRLKPYKRKIYRSSLINNGTKA